MNIVFTLICYFVIALIVFAILDYFYAKENNVSADELAFMSVIWILLFVVLIFAMPFYLIDKLIKRKNKL